MKVLNIVCGPIENNVYLVYNEVTLEAFVVDPTLSQPVIDKANELGLTIKAVLLTHGHFDHIAGVKDIQDLGAKVYIHKLDLPKILEPGKMAQMMNIYVKPFVADVVIDCDTVINVIGYKIRVIETPGHSAGGVCYVLDTLIFCGDTIFRGSFGRYDFKDSSFCDLKHSILKIMDLEGDYILLCGHGENTTLDFERQNNPIIDC